MFTLITAMSLLAFTCQLEAGPLQHDFLLAFCMVLHHGPTDLNARSITVSNFLALLCWILIF